MAKAKSSASKRGSQKRDLVKPRGGARYTKRKKGKFTEQDRVGPSLRRDRQQKAKNTVQPGFGDQGDQRTM
jgi:hypothetical protein